MQKTAIKNFAVWARTTLIEAVTQNAFEYEITEHGKNDPSLESVGGRPLTELEKQQRRQLIDRIGQNGFMQTMEEAAYTWFNRFIALRFMEVNNYLPSRIRVFTDDTGAFKPEILSEAMSVEIDGLNREYVMELLESQDNEALYKYLLITQCNALHGGLPEMFETIGGWTELLFPQHLLRSDSVIDRMVADIPEEDWTDQVQIIGWLYQYYNTELKEQVFARLKKNVKIKKESIPAATQLFTPDWIVRYMVENSLGRLWIEHLQANNGISFPMTFPISSEDNNSVINDLKSNWKYYLDEAEQEPDVQAQLATIREKYKTLKPEDIRVIDPCMGSGHILVYAFEVLMQIYTACGWSERDAAKSILEKNLYGLDIDKRAYQLAYFALMMKARKYNRRILTSGIQPNLAHFQDISNVRTEFLQEPLRTFVEQFKNADTYGSLLEVNDFDNNEIAELIENFEEDIFTQGYTEILKKMLNVYKLLSQRYEICCTNPPYMGGSGMNAELSAFVKKKFPDSKSDLFACFMEKCGSLVKADGFYAMITQHAWMFLSSYENLRKKLMLKSTVNMAHLGARAFDEIGGEVVQTTAFVDCGRRVADFEGTYARLVDTVGEHEKEKLFLSGEKRYTAKQENFSKIPGSPVAYWVSERFLSCFVNKKPLDDNYYMREGIHTADNDRFLRLWFETSFDIIVMDADCYDDIDRLGKWVPYNKGGQFRKWYGNNDYVIAFDEKSRNSMNNLKGHVRPSQSLYFKEGGTWTAVSGGSFGIRYYPKGFLFDAGGQVCVGNNIYSCLAYLNSSLFAEIAKITMPTINFKCGVIKTLPDLRIKEKETQINSIVNENIIISKTDWDSYETSWDFERHPLV